MFGRARILSSKINLKIVIPWEKNNPTPRIPSGDPRIENNEEILHVNRRISSFKSVIGRAANQKNIPRMK
jgi:hypothetical protein